MALALTALLEGRLRRMLPAGTILLAALLDLAPIPDAAPYRQAPDLMLAAVFFWSLHRPGLVPAPALFALALGRDLVAGSLIGLTPATLLVLREVVIHRQRQLQAAPPLLGFAAFAFYAAAIALVRWLAACAWSLHWLAPGPVLGSLLLTVLAWPLMAFVLAGVQAMLPRRDHAAGS